MLTAILMQQLIILKNAGHVIVQENQFMYSLKTHKRELGQDMHYYI